MKRTFFIISAICLVAFLSCDKSEKNIIEVNQNFNECIEKSSVPMDESDVTEEYAEAVIRECLKKGDLEYVFSMLNAREQMAEDLLLTDTYEVSRGSYLPDVLTAIIDRYSANEIESVFDVSYDSIINYLRHIILYGSSHSTVTTAWMHRLISMNDAKQIDVILSLLKEGDYSLFMDVLWAAYSQSEDFEFFFETLKHEYAIDEKLLISYDGLIFILDMTMAVGASYTGEIFAVPVDNSLDCFHSNNERMQIKEVFETDKYILTNIKYDCIYDVLVYEKNSDKVYWLSRVSSFQEYYKGKIDYLKNCYESEEDNGFPYIGNRILSISPNGKYAFFQKSLLDNEWTMAVKYCICRLDDLNTLYLLDGFTTKHMISWLEDAYEWTNNGLRIASWTSKYDDLYTAEQVRKPDVYEIYVSNSSIDVEESNIQYDYSARKWFY